jgi:hypothetical protein
VTLEKQAEPRYKAMPTFILCNPNAMFYQYMVNQPHAYYLRYFLNKNINVMVWNYRGYGLSNGRPDPTNIRRDGDQILRYIRGTLGLTGKIGVYGRSLGGVVTTHLIDQVDFVFADRTFSNFEVLSNRKFFSNIAKYLFKLSSGGWVINNDLNVLHKTRPSKPPCYRVLLTERKDEVIEVHSSLMTGVARAFLGRKHLAPGENFYLSLTQLKDFITSSQFIVNMEHDLYTVIEWANEQQQHRQQQYMPPSRLFCLGRWAAYSRNRATGRVHPDVEFSESHPFPSSPANASNGNTDLLEDVEDARLRNKQGRRLIRESRTRLKGYFDRRADLTISSQEEEGLPLHVFEVW